MSIIEYIITYKYKIISIWTRLPHKCEIHGGRKCKNHDNYANHSSLDKYNRVEDNSLKNYPRPISVDNCSHNRSSIREVTTSSGA